MPGFELEPLLKALPVLLFLIDRDGTFLNFHAGNPDDLPLPPEQIVGSNIRDLPDAKLGKQTLASLKRVFRTGTPERFEYRVETRRGWQHYVCHLRRYGVNEVLASIRNITEQTHQRKQQQQRTEAILRESEAKYRTLGKTLRTCSTARTWRVVLFMSPARSSGFQATRRRRRSA